MNAEPLVAMSGAVTTETSPAGAGVGDPIPKLKGPRRLLQSLQRISSSPSLARMHRKPTASYRSGTKGSISCVSLSSSTSTTYGHSSAHLGPSDSSTAFPTLSIPGSTTQNPDAHFFDPTKSRSGIRLIEAELASSAAAPTPLTCPVPTRLRSSSRPTALAATPEVSEAARDYFSKPHAGQVDTGKEVSKREDFDFWGSMPGEIKTRVFQFLEPKEIVRCSRVCRSWYDLCFDGQLWKSVDASEFYRDITASSLAKLITAAGPFVRDLNLRGCIQLQDHSRAEMLSDACQNLEYVSLEGCRLERGSVHYLLHRNSRLVHLNLTGLAAVSNATCKIIAQHCPELKYLNVSWCSNMDARGVRRIVDGCPRLEDLRVSEIRGFDDEAVMLSLFNINNLHRLVLNGCTSLVDKTLKILLEGVDPEICPLENRALVSPRRLRHLDLSRCHQLTNAGVEKLAHNVPDLEGLQLAGCIELTDPALTVLLPTTPKLTHLDLEELPNLTNTTLQSLAESPCRLALAHLSISSCENLGDPGMLPVIKACRSLQSIDMDNTRISDLVLAEAASVVRQRSRPSASPRVGLRIVAYDCQNVTWTGIREVLSSNTEQQQQQQLKRTPLAPPSSSYPTEIIQLKCFYGWQMTVEEHTKRVLRGDLAAATRLERKWAEYMMSNEEAGVAGAGGRRRRRRAREAAMMHADEEGGEGGMAGGGRRRRARSGGCLVM
ncbi:MAG: hypothetical protein M1816_001477 [Peltula sp. TS41687]|nr:MAG: hypothetical protein M1816_001477 [Peltula sp. TS41687]